ncbi:MAG: beta-lactamase family protein, partial [Hyphomonadaceae bacterium]|nr:beta-lactamase family protein [Hyphomonadaceae bacterium]
AVLCRDLDFLCAPGLHYNYCNAGYCLLGRIVETQTGVCFEEAAQQFLCRPLGLDRLMGRAENTLAHRVAVGHAPGANGALALAPLTILPRALVPAGLTLYATPSDILTFAAAHFPSASAAMPKRILSHATAAQMRQPQTTLPDCTHWGLGWKLIPARTRTFAGHDGGTVGQSAYLWAEPESETIVAISANGGLSAAAFKQIADPIFRAACGDIPEPQLPAILSDPGDLQVYEGVYENAGVRMVLRAEGDHVHGVAQQKYFGMPDIVFTMRPAGDHKFRVSLGGDDTIVMSFPSFNAAGRPDLFYAGRLHRRTGG